MPDRLFSLEPLTVPEARGVALVDIAAAAGFDGFGMFAFPPAPQLPADPAVGDRAMRAEMIRRMRETGVRLCNLECFNLTPDADPADFAEALACGAEMGAGSATAIVWENGDRADALAKFRRTCDMAHEHGIAVNLEFFGACRTIPTLDAAAAFVRDADRANAGLVLDLLHLVRTSGGAPALASLNPGLIGAVQLCDGHVEPREPDPQAESIERLAPGEGDFPIAEFLARIPDALVIGVEVPQASQFGKVPPLERARRLAASLPDARFKQATR